MGIFRKLVAEPKQRARPPRNDMSCSATLVANNRFYRAELLNVSHGGCKVRSLEGPLGAGTRVQIALEAFHSLSGIVRWSNENEFGMQFSTPISDYLLGKWNAQLEKARSPEAAMPLERGPRDFWGQRRRPIV